MFDRIVLPVDLTDVSHIGLLTAQNIATKFGSKVYLIYVIKHIKDIPFEIFKEEVEAIELLKDKLKKESESILSKYVLDLKEKNIEAEYHILEGDDVESILNFSKGVNADLIVMPSHKKTNVEIRAVGSVSLRVASKSSSSVLIVKQKHIQEIKNILVNYDFLPSSVNALEKAVNLARKFGSKITVLHVDNDEHHTHIKFIYQKLLQKKVNLLEEVKNQHKDLNMETLIIKGNPKEEILKVINSNNFDLIVMGRRNPIDKSRVFLGSLSLEVLKNSPISVLISRSNDV